MKKLILIDLDGVLNKYSSDFRPDYIPPLNSQAEDMLKKLHKRYNLKLFTTRNATLAAQWLSENNLDSYFVGITNIKELCWLFIDDRSICFDGDYETLYEKVKYFKPWYKKVEI